MSEEYQWYIPDEELDAEDWSMFKPEHQPPYVIWNPDNDNGVVHEGCNYLAHNKTVCNKCGQYVEA